ncbi:hypothetical protein BC629DRAFT_350275 [Irpex lacteus]|nr:hypothetical protein BC629DRAFT_350275 [Irpex lacteus]
MSTDIAHLKGWRPHKLQCPWYSREDKLGIRVNVELQPAFDREALIVHAEERLHAYHHSHEQKHQPQAMSLIGFAVENLDHVVSIVDGLVEVHPMCKVAWMVLGSVYKAFKDQHTLDHQTHELAKELRDTLAYVKACRGLRSIPEATDVLLELTKLAVETAAAFDAHIKHSIMARALIGAVIKESERRISECYARLKVLRTKLQETLMIRIYQSQTALLAQHGLSHDDSNQPSRKQRENTSEERKVYAPLIGRHRSGYSPLYVSPPLDEPIRRPSPPPNLFMPLGDDFRRLTSSPEPMEPHVAMLPPPVPLRPPFRPSSMPNPYSIGPMWSPGPMASRTPSLATDTGRTLSSKSSCSSLSDMYDCLHTEPTIYAPESADLYEEVEAGKSTIVANVGVTANTVRDTHAPWGGILDWQPKPNPPAQLHPHKFPKTPPLAMPTPLVPCRATRIGCDAVCKP